MGAAREIVRIGMMYSENRRDFLVVLVKQQEHAIQLHTILYYITGLFIERDAFIM